MRKMKKILVEQEKVQEVICNRCGRHFPEEKRDVTDLETLHVEQCWGYFSEKDGERQSFDLCEECYDEIIKSFRVPVEIERQGRKEPRGTRG